MKGTKLLILLLVGMLALGGCTRVDFEIPEPVQKVEQNKNDNGGSDNPSEIPENPSDPEGPNDTPDEPQQPDVPAVPSTPQEPETPATPEGPAYSARVKWVSSAEELGGLNIVAGDTIVWRKGKYADVNISFSAKGTSTNPVVFTGEKGGEVIFTGASPLAVTGEWVRVENLWWQNPTKTPITVKSGSSNVVISECAITGYGTSISTKDYKWVSLYGRNNKVSNCFFDDKRNMGTLLVVWMEKNIVPAHTIENNYFSRPNSINNGENGQETIRIGSSDYSLEDAACSVRGNYFYKCDAETEIVSNKSCGNLYEGNLFRASGGVLTLRHGNDCIVRNNYFLGDKASNTGGVRIIGEGHLVENNYMENLRGNGYKTAICIVRGEENAELSGYAQVKGAVVRNNTIVGCRYSLHLNYANKDSMNMPVIGTTISGNTIYCTSSSDYAAYVYTSPTPQITWSENKIYGGKQSGVSLATLSAKPSIPSVKQAVEKIENTCGPKWKTVIK